MISHQWVADIQSLKVESDYLILKEVDANVFATIKIQTKVLGLAWNGSKAIDIQEWTDFKMVTIGVGESFLAMNQESGIVRLVFGLGFPYQFIVRTEYGVAVVSELTIVVVSFETCAINRTITASDVIQDVVFEGGKFVVTCLDSSFVV